MRTGSIYAIQYADGTIKFGTSSSCKTRWRLLSYGRRALCAIASPRIEEASYKAEQWMLTRARKMMIQSAHGKEYFTGSFGDAVTLVRQAHKRFGTSAIGWRVYSGAVPGVARGIYVL